ncbi:MAG: FHA domain-containing protein [Pseudomonadota bacterium]|jgi:hypothetical protein
MFNWLRKILANPTSRGGANIDRASNGRRFDDILVAPGKASSAALLELASTLSRDEFINLLHCPFLIGSAIRDGNLLKPDTGSGDVLAAKTFLFNAAQVDQLIQGGSVEHSIYVLRKDSAGQSSATIASFSIGRAKENDIRIVDFAISRLHATIELVGSNYLVKDCDSRNGTRINGYAVGAKGSYIKDGNSLSLGRYEFGFYLPGTMYDKLRGYAGTR